MVPTTDYNKKSQPQESIQQLQQKRMLLSTIVRAAILGAAFIATIWMIGMLNSGSLFTGESPTSTLLGIPAQRSH